MYLMKMMDLVKERKQITATSTIMQELKRLLAAHPPLETFVNSQYLKYVGHTCRRENTRLTKKMLFAIPTKPYFRDPWLKISNLMGISIEQAKRTTQSRKKFAELVRKCANPPS